MKPSLLSWKPILILCFVFSAFLFSSCETEQLDKMPDEFSWQLNMIFSSDHEKSGGTENVYPLTFDRETKGAKLRLDVNSCWTDYEITENSIKFGGFHCTRICCDTPFANKFALLLSESTFEWKMGATDLLLEKEGVRIYLRRM